MHVRLHPPLRRSRRPPLAGLALVGALAGMLAGAPGGPRAAAAQEAGARAALDAWRDSLARVGDTTRALAIVRAAKDALHARRDDPLLLTRLGFAELRAADLGKWRRYGAASGAFARAARVAPAWPYPVYGEALARFGDAEATRRNPLNIGIRVGVGALRDAVELLARAVGIDPAFAPALEDLGVLPLRLREPEMWRTALAALRARRDDAAAPVAPGVLLALGRIEREVGDPDSALAAFDRYLATGADPGLARLERARTRLSLGRPGGDEDYYAGAESDDPAVVAEYRADLAVILPDSMLAEFDRVRGAARAALLRGFWADRDAIELRRPGERLAEHYRRLFYARRNFALATTRRVYWPVSGCTVRTGSTEFDDRGIIYIRHGEPTQRLRTPLFNVMPNESWRYERPDGDLLFHFGAGSDIHDYRLLESVLDLYTGCSSRDRPPAAAPAPAEMLVSRERLDPIYGKLAAWYGTEAGWRELARERGMGATSIAIGTTTDGYELRFPERLPVAVRTVAVGRAGARSLVHVVFAVPGPATRPDETPEGWRHALRLRFAAYDARGRVVAHVDSALALYTERPVGRGEYLYGRVALAVPPGTWRYRAALQYGDSAGAVLPRDTLRVAGFDGPALALSDLVLGWRPAPLVWRPTAEDTVYFSPFSRYGAADEIELYYEIYGLAPGTTYRTELVVTPQARGGLFRGAPAPVRFASSAAAGAGPERGRRTLRLATLRPGRYWLDLQVTDAQGRRVQRRTAFDVLPAASTPAGAR